MFKTLEFCAKCFLCLTLVKLSVLNNGVFKHRNRSTQIKNYCLIFIFTYLRRCSSRRPGNSNQGTYGACESLVLNESQNNDGNDDRTKEPTSDSDIERQTRK